MHIQGEGLTAHASGCRTEIHSCLVQGTAHGTASL